MNPTTLAGGTIALHFDDRGMSWGTNAAATAGDEVRLDRSWCQGRRAYEALRGGRPKLALVLATSHSGSCIVCRPPARAGRNLAVATTVLIDRMYVTGCLDYLSVTGCTFEVNKQPFPAGTEEFKDPSSAARSTTWRGEPSPGCARSS